MDQELCWWWQKLVQVLFLFIIAWKRYSTKKPQSQARTWTRKNSNERAEVWNWFCVDLQDINMNLEIWREYKPGHLIYRKEFCCFIFWPGVATNNVNSVSRNEHWMMRSLEKLLTGQFGPNHPRISKQEKIAVIREKLGWSRRRIANTTCANDCERVLILP